MNPLLEVVAPGLHTTVQDAGRHGFQSIGIPASGPLDRVGLRVANALVGNEAGASGLEILLQGPTLKVHAESVRVALVGCNSQLEVRSQAARRIAAGASTVFYKDEVFRVGALGDSVGSPGTELEFAL